MAKLTNPLVSILIPCYNSEQNLSETIKSALAQTWKNIEIIIVDDGSTDNSLALAKSFESSIVKVISQENQGQSASENKAFAESQGDFIEYLDADDLLAPDKIERQIKLLENSDSFVASCEWSRFYKSPKEAMFISQPLWKDLDPVDWLVCAWEGHYMMHGATWLIPRKIVEKAGGWDERLSLINDFEYFSRVLLASEGVKFCSGARTYYRSGNTSSLSGSKSTKARQSQFLSLSLGTSNLLAKENSLRTRHVCATVFQRFIYEVYPDVPELSKQAAAKVKELGGSNLKPTGGLMFQFLSKLVGWQQAKKMQKLSYQYGYQKTAVGWKLSKLQEKIIYVMNN
ncbi:glycosyl transferase family 2 [Stanieria cyanosphaera PCC 7437]|uniref:Glycosyl transferase family 2 n=1 Tax=Stanieria cyanosphaera (strain ATCC 29371 / PCC 7437) TaxID=111780 RepID=K9XU70_STAC7|nr:glycosyltransferase [Stanieria cyanosphaera]AFZ36145.1 glycosyl transferase family 2 [Stanieria cyanosphaera PCC 7437]